MRRLAVVGISGTGKTALGARIAAQTGLPVYPIDAIIWSPGWTETPEHQIEAALARIAAAENWIVEGWIDRYSLGLLHRCDVILDLDYPGRVAALGVVRRWLAYRGRRRPELPVGCVESLDPGSLRDALQRRERPHVAAILAQVNGVEILRVRSRAELERVLPDVVARVGGAGSAGTGVRAFPGR